MRAMPDIDRLCEDLRAEHRALDDIVGPLSSSDWDMMTPAPTWTVRDQISHLHFFDTAAHQAVTDPQGFIASLEQAAADIDGYMNGPLERGRTLPSNQVLDEWRTDREAMLHGFLQADPTIRVPWYGPPMSLGSFISARLMETWAHGQDVADAVGVERQPTERLKHVAHLGVRARPYSYVVNNKDQPEGDVRVELTAPSGELWTWGDSATDVVSGNALSFCLVVTQRRHPADTDLQVRGPLAKEWISIAQCFAGPPGAGRTPGQFASSR